MTVVGVIDCQLFRKASEIGTSLSSVFKVLVFVSTVLPKYHRRNKFSVGLEISAREQDTPGAKKYHCYSMHGWSQNRVQCLDCQCCCSRTSLIQTQP